MVPVPQAFRHVQAGEQTRGFSGAGFTRYAGIEQRLHHHFQCRNTRDDAQKLAHQPMVVLRISTTLRAGAVTVYPFLTVFDLDLPFVGQMVGVQRAQRVDFPLPEWP
ncbi:hypothetical protein ECZU26_16720 [Escherichia coli]|nr:hypothetical protein ECZU26_16720 [Escherichia coli]